MMVLSGSAKIPLMLTKSKEKVLLVGYGVYGAGAPGLNLSRIPSPLSSAAITLFITHVWRASEFATAKLPSSNDGDVRDISHSMQLWLYVDVCRNATG